MQEFFTNTKLTIEHLKAFNDFFNNVANYPQDDRIDYEIYSNNLNDFISSFTSIDAFKQLYNQSDRQLILADLIEYFLFGRVFYSLGTSRDSIQKRGLFTKGILHLVNLLMCYESITVDVNRRNSFLDYLVTQIPDIANEDDFDSLRAYNGSVGLPGSTETRNIKKYFDKLLPKTAGGLWHELLVYIFLLRNDFGYIIPLLLHQKLYSKTDH